MRKKIILVFPFLLMLSVTKVSAQYEGTFGMGVHTNYATEIATVGLGVNAHYYTTNKWRIAPSFTYYIKHQGTTLCMAEADMHYMLPIGIYFSAYPIAGANYSNVRYKSGDQLWTKNRLGLNFGLGLQYDYAYNRRFSIEYKYQLVANQRQSIISAGVGFWF